MNVLSLVIWFEFNFVALNHFSIVALIKRHIHSECMHLHDLVVMMVFGYQHMVQIVKMLSIFMLFSKEIRRLHVGQVPVDEILLLLSLSSLSLFLLSLDSVLFFLADPPLFFFVVPKALSFFFGLYSSPLSFSLGLMLLSFSLGL